MRNLIQMHIGLFQYLSKEIPKKKTLKELIGFLKNIGKQYLKVNLQMYKNLFLMFDKDFKQQKKKYEKEQQMKKDLQRALKMLQYIDKKLAKDGWNRQRRRQFWRDFFKDGQIRTEVFNALENEIK